MPFIRIYHKSINQIMDGWISARGASYLSRPEKRKENKKGIKNTKQDEKTKESSTY